MKEEEKERKEKRNLLVWGKKNKAKLLYLKLLLRWLSSKISACQAGDTCLIPGQEDPMEKKMAFHSNILAWEIPWTVEPDGLQFMVSRLSN